MVVVCAQMPASWVSFEPMSYKTHEAPTWLKAYNSMNYNAKILFSKQSWGCQIHWQVLFFVTFVSVIPLYMQDS